LQEEHGLPSGEVIPEMHEAMSQPWVEVIIKTKT